MPREGGHQRSLLHWRWVSQAERSQIVDAASWGSSTRGICGVLQPGAQLRIVVPEDLQVCGGSQQPAKGPWQRKHIGRE